MCLVCIALRKPLLGAKASTGDGRVVDVESVSQSIQICDMCILKELGLQNRSRCIL